MDMRIARALVLLSKVLVKSTGLLLVLSGLAATASAGACPPPATPEIDPGSILSALTLLGGGVMVLTDRYRAGV